jgi:hypothetical protein
MSTVLDTRFPNPEARSIHPNDELLFTNKLDLWNNGLVVAWSLG